MSIGAVQPRGVSFLRLSLVRAPAPLWKSRPYLRDSAEAAKVFAAAIPDDQREHVWIAAVDTGYRLNGLYEVSVGTLTSSLVHPREVFTLALEAGAMAIIVAHNHPSGSPEPSAEDIALTRRLASAGALIGIEVLDHVIVCHEPRTYSSLKERGAL